jgi:hypothetical protein
MSLSSRFGSFFDDDDGDNVKPRSVTDAEIMKRVSHVKITAYRDTDGDIHGEVEISCGFGCFSGDADQDGTDAESAQGAELARRVLTEFLKKPKGGVA